MSDEVQLRVTEAQAERSALQKELTEHQQEISSLRQVVSIANDELSDVKTALEHEMMSSRALTKRLEEVKALKLQGDTQLSSFSAENERLRSFVSDLSAGKETMLSEFEALRTQLAAAEHAKDVFQEQMGHVSAQYEDSRAVISKMQLEYRTLKQQKDQETMQSKLVKEELQKALEQAVQHAKQLTQEATVARQELSKQAAGIQSNFDSLVKEMQENHAQELKQKVREAVDKERQVSEQEIQKQRDSAAHLSAMLEEVQHSLDTANSEIEHRELALTRKVDELQRKLDEEKRKVQKHLEQQVKLLEVIEREEKLKPNEIRVAIRDFKPNDVVFFMRRKHGNGSETWEILNQGAPHFFLSPQAAEQLARKIPAGSEVPFVRMQILYVEELMANAKLNPFKLSPGTVYHVVHPYPLEAQGEQAGQAGPAQRS